MPDEHTQPYDGLARWLAEDTADDPSMPRTATDDDERPRRRRNLRIAALALPWVITLGALVATAGIGDPPADHVGGRRSSGVAAADGAPRPGGVQPSAADHGSEGEPAAADTAATGARRPPDGLTGVAIGLVRDAITARHGDTTRAVDVATAERPRPLERGHWLVRVRVVVLAGDTRRWRSATHEVWAVPVAARAGGVVGVDHPWRVASERPRIVPTGWHTAEVDRSAVTAALRRIAARPADDLDAQRHPDLTGIIRVRTAADDGAHVWLGTEPDVHVLGAGERVVAEEDAS
jgi:hypothetical protein